MNLTLTRNDNRADGIFSTLTDESGSVIAVTLEHAYSDVSGAFLPKVYNGTFSCKRGPHRLHNMTQDFETFEITGVDGHQNILFHWGNYNKDSEGCVLLGSAIAESGSNEMITNSRATFAKFMALQDGVDQFELTVV